MSSSFKASKDQAMLLYSADGRRKYINHSERTRFIYACYRADAPIRRFGLTLAYTGARLSEARSLRQRDVQIAEGRIALQTLKRRRKGVFREVAVDPSLLRDFAPIVGNGGDDWIWAANGDALPRIKAYRWIKSLMAEAGIEGLQASPKGLRHGFAVHAVLSGVPVTTLQKWMGHASLETTLVYTTLLGPEELQLASRMWNAMDDHKTG